MKTSTGQNITRLHYFYRNLILFPVKDFVFFWSISSALKVVFFLSFMTDILVVDFPSSTFFILTFSVVSTLPCLLYTVQNQMFLFFYFFQLLSRSVCQKAKCDTCNPKLTDFTAFLACSLHCSQRSSQLLSLFAF